MISVIIPTYKEPKVLDLCLTSAIQCCTDDSVQFIVVVDGFLDENRTVLEKYRDRIDVLPLEQNVGLARATNLGVYNARHEIVLVVNDDNVFPPKWNERLLEDFNHNRCLSPNQVEPRPSMFPQFIIEDLEGPDTLNLGLFYGKHERDYYQDKIERTGSTLPFMVTKQNYLRVGGWDESYPGHWVVDWEFFMKLELAGLDMYRTYKVNMYHFGSVATASPEKMKAEQECHEWFKYKWGQYAKHNPTTNSKLLY